MPRPAARRNALHSVLDLFVAGEGGLPPLGAILLGKKQWSYKRCGGHVRYTSIVSLMHVTGMISYLTIKTDAATVHFRVETSLLLLCFATWKNVGTSC